MGNHTPGPWDYDKDSKEIFSCDEGHGCGWIALVGGNDSNGRRLPDEMRAANCSLIAAAPELLSALKAVLACGGWDGDGNFVIPHKPHDRDEDTSDPDCLVQASSAIAKAEGRAE